MISHHRKRDKGNGLDRVSEYTLTHECQRHHKFNLWLLQNLMMYHMRTTDVNPASPSAGPRPSAEQRGRSRRNERSRSRERVPPHSSSHARQQPQLIVPLSGAQQTQTAEGSDVDAATVDPQDRVSDRSRSPQEQESSRRQGPQIHKRKQIAAEKQPSGVTKAKKHKSMDSDEDDEEPQNEPGTSSTSQPTEPVLLFHQRPAAST